ncbi:MAG: hypothetical protein IJB31_04105 [Akkermansia sp.]|nr:hypothetical protein [Akkermansia sp.]
MKQGRKLSGKKREEAERLGIATQMEGGEDLLADLEGLRAKFEMVGSYPDLVAQAQLYDGKTEVDPVGQLLEQQRAQREREQGLKELDAEAYLRAKQAEAVPELSFSVTQEMEDIEAAAEKDGTFMTAPNGKPTNLTERQWLQVRTKAFKEWFGDWEKVARFRSAIDKLRSMDDVCAITGDEFAPDGRKLTDKVTEFWSKEYGGVAKNPILGEVILDTRSVKASIAHGVGRLKSAAFAVVHDVIEQGVLVEIAPNWKGRGDDSYVIAAPVQIGGVSYVCEVVVMKGETRTGFYLHEVQIKEKLLDVFKTGVVTGTSGAPQSILLDVWNRVKEIEENCSKVVDENGEPLVVYHGSPTGGFTIFRNESYFSPFMWYAEKYKHPSASSNRSSRDVGTPMLYEVFLNIRKPFDTRNAAEKKIFETDFFRKWGNGAPLSERGLPDWTDASDLLEFIEENELDYDGLILDEGGYPDGNGSVILRGHSFVPVTPNQIRHR